MNKQELRGIIRSHIRSGLLRCSSGEDHLFGGNGDGGTCACCGGTIGATETQYEVVDCTGASLHMHLFCYDEWRTASTVLEVAVTAY